MKKATCILIVILMLISMSACHRNDPIGTNKTEYKVAIITRPFSEDKTTFETAQQLKDKHNSVIVTTTYPHNYDTHPEQTVAMITQLAEDLDIHAMIFAEVVDGTAAGIKKVREKRNDILIITGMNKENAAEIAPLSDLCLIENQTVTGTTIIEQSVAMGAETFVYITCQNDLANSAINAHEEVLKETCSLLGLPFVEAIAPDPFGVDGVIGTQAWVNENIPLYVEKYGKNTAFYATNEAMSIPLLQQVAMCGAILPQLCNPSPYHGFPEAFDIDLEDREADIDYLLKQIRNAISSYGNNRRMAAWSVTKNMIVLRAGVEYCMKWCEGTVTERCHRYTMNAAINSAAGNDAKVYYYTDEKIGLLSQSFSIQDGYYIF